MIFSVLFFSRASRIFKRILRHLLGVLHELSLPEGPFTTILPDECISEVLEYLSIDDLCSVNRTCKRLQALSEVHFDRKYQHLASKRVLIRKFRNGEIGFDSNERYIKCFSRKLQSFVLSFPEGKMNDELLQFMRTNCGENIKEITFHGWQYSKSFEEGIRTVLKNVETITIDSHAGNSNMRLDVVLHNLPALKHLNAGYFADVESWRNVKGLQLESLSCNVDRRMGLGSVNLQRFLWRNPKVKCLKCAVDDDDLIKPILKKVAKVAQIEELLFIFHCWRTDFSSIRNQLKILDERAGFKRFGLTITDGSCLKNVFELASLKSFSILRLWDCEFSDMEKHIPELNLMVNLEVLEFVGENSINDKIAMNLSKNLVNLRKLAFLENKEWLPKKNVVDVLKTFIRNAPKLTEIELQECGIDEKELSSNVPVFIAERKKLENATRLIIFITNDGETIPSGLRKNNNEELVVVKKVRYRA